MKVSDSKYNYELRNQETQKLDQAAKTSYLPVYRIHSKSHIRLNSFKGRSVQWSKVSFKRGFRDCLVEEQKFAGCIALYTYAPQKA